MPLFNTVKSKKPLLLFDCADRSEALYIMFRGLGTTVSMELPLTVSLAGTSG